MGIDLDSYRIHIGCFNGVFVHIHARRNPTFPAANCRTLLLKGFLGKAVSFLVIAVLLMRGGVELNPGPCARALQTRRRGEVEEIKLNKDHTFLSHAKSFGFFVDYINANAAYLQTSTFSSTADLHEEHSTKSSQSKVFSKTKLLCKPTCQFHPKDTNCTVNRYFKSQKNIYVDELFSKKDFGLYYYSKTHQIQKCVFHAPPGKLCNVSITEEDESLADYHSDNVHPVNKNNTTVTGHPTNAFDTFINDVTMYDLLLFLPFYHNEKEIPVDTNDVKRKGLDMPSCKPKIVKSTTLETVLGVDGPRGDLFPIGRGDGWVYMVLSCFEDAVVLSYNFIRAILYTTFALAQSTANFGFLASPADLAVSFAIHVANVATYVATLGRHFCKACLLRSSELCRKGRMKFTLTLRTRLHEFFFMARRQTDLCLEAIHTAERTSDNHLTLNNIHLCRKQTIPDSKCLQRDVLGAFKITDGNTLRAVLGCQESLCNNQIRKDVDLNERVTGQLKVLTTPGQFCFHRVTIVYSMAYPWWLLYRQTLCLCRSTRASARANVSRGKDRALSTAYTLTDKCYRKYTMCILEKYLWQQSFCATIIQNSNGNTKIKFPDLDLDGNVDGNVNANLNTSPKGKFISLRNNVNSSTMLDFDSHVFLLKSSFLFLLFLSCILGSLRFSGLWGILRCCFGLLLQSDSAVVLLPYSVVMCLSIMLGIRMTLSQITWSKNMFVALSRPLVQFQEITHFNFVTIFFNCSFLSPTLHYDYKEKPSPEEKSSSMEKSNPKNYSPKEKPSHKKKSCPDANSNPKQHSVIEKSSPKEKPIPIKKSCPKEKPSPKKTSCLKKKPSPKEKPSTMEKSSPMKKSSPFDCRRPTCQSLYLSTQTYPLSFVCICFDGLTCAILKHSRTGVTQVEGEYLGYNKYVHSGQSELITWRSDVDKDYHLPIQGLDSRHVFDNITTMLNVQHSRNRTGNEILLLTCVKFDFSACTQVKDQFTSISHAGSSRCFIIQKSRF